MVILKPEIVCAVIISYNPEWRQLQHLICSLKEQLGEVIVIDNNSREEIKGLLYQKSIEIGFKLQQNTTNFGIAKALNQGVEVAKVNGYRWTFTFDQDSKVMKQLVDYTLTVFNGIAERNTIGAIGVNALKSNNEVYYQFEKGASFKEKDYLITSGTLISIDIFDKIGGFREDFFIDNVDLEYSLRLKSKGYKSIITKDPGMLHDPGNPIMGKVMGRWIASSNHSSLRRYYMARNHVRLSKIYGLKFPYFILKTTYFFVLSILFLIILEANRKEKLKMTFKGLKDGFLKSSLQVHQKQLISNISL
jgi:rhamnosyltransferase